MSGAAQARIQSWSGTEEAFPLVRAVPGSEDEVAAVLAHASAEDLPVKPAGALHSFNGVALTDGVSLSLDRMQRILAVDAEAGTVRVQAGIRLHRLMAALHELGLALPVRGSVDEQSVAGAISTATHGSAPRVGNLASLVTAMRLVTADGQAHRLSRRSAPDTFAAARVGLGALGVISEVTMRVVPAFRLAETVESLPYDEAAGRIEEIRTTSEFVKLWWLPTTDRLLVFRYERTDEPVTSAPLADRVSGWVDTNVVNRTVIPALWQGLRVVPAAMNLVARGFSASYFRPRRTVGESHRILGLAMPYPHREAAWVIPVDRAGDALRAVRDTAQRERLRLDMIQEFRFVAADDAWMSPMYGRDSFVVGAITGRSADTDRYFAAVQALSRDLGGRPHWAKEFDLTPEDLRALYPRYEDFRRVRADVDPAGMFRNAFLDRLLPAEDRGTRGEE
jgi:FAD-linked oxidoreductase